MPLATPALLQVSGVWQICFVPSTGRQQKPLILSVAFWRSHEDLAVCDVGPAPTPARVPQYWAVSHSHRDANLCRLPHSSCQVDVGTFIVFLQRLHAPDLPAYFAGMRKCFPQCGQSISMPLREAATHTSLLEV